VTLPVRTASVGPRRRTVARASAGLSAARVLAAFALLASAAALYGLTWSTAFRMERLEIQGAGHTSRAAVRETLQARIGEAPNLFRVRTGEVIADLRVLPAVLSVDVRVALPDRLVVAITERQAILVWRVGERRFLVDAEGVLFAKASPEAGEGLPVIRDLRSAAPGRAVGERLDPVDLAVVRQLGALTPAALGSTARSLSVEVDDREGFTVDARPTGWHAIFGFYLSRLRTPELVPRQAQCLAALLVEKERTISTIFLSPERERCGTFTTRR
jgi:cell division septal protein FtsQ